MNLIKKFPFISLAQSLIILRLCLAGIFLAHAIVRIFDGSIGQFGEFMESKGFYFGVAWVWAITIVELLAGVMLIFGCYVNIACAGLIIILLVGIIIIHAQLGWFVGEHGTGGSEYSVTLIAALLVVAADHNRKLRDANKATGKAIDTI